MNTHNTLPKKTSFWQKLTLVLFVATITFVLLEIGLRVGGFIILSLQKQGNLTSIRQRGEYRILCLGDSTTQNQYPFFLEAFLNQKKTGTRFIVIDKEIPGATSLAIVNKVESYLDSYHPDMVVVMMGINDRIKALCARHPSSKIITCIRSMRTYKLILLFWERALNRVKELSVRLKKSRGVKEHDNKNKDRLKKALVLNPGNDVAHAHLGWIYQRQSRYLESEEYYKKALELNPRNDLAYIGLGWLSRAQGQVSKAEEYFKKALEINPRSDWAYAELGWLYRTQGLLKKAEECDKKALEFNPKSTWAYLELGLLKLLKDQLPEAEQNFRRSLELNPANDWAYSSLGWLYRIKGLYLKAEEHYKKALELNPRNDLAYMGLGWLSKAEGQLSKAEEYFKKALDLNPRNDSAYVELGWVYRAQGLLTKTEKYNKKALELNPKNTWAYLQAGLLEQSQKQYALAEDHFKKAFGLNPGNDAACLELTWLYRLNGNLKIAEKYLKKSLESKLQNKLRLYAALSSIYDEDGQYALAQSYDAKAKNMELHWYNPITSYYYHELKEILDKRSIRLVCVQYPLRRVESLKTIFQGQKRIIFVDNEGIFNEAVKREGYKQYFINMLGGNFGQCSPEGEKLLAENIARAILKEVLDEQIY